MYYDMYDYVYIVVIFEKKLFNVWVVDVIVIYRVILCCGVWIGIRNFFRFYVVVGIGFGIVLLGESILDSFIRKREKSWCVILDWSRISLS